MESDYSAVSDDVPDVTLGCLYGSGLSSTLLCSTSSSETVSSTTSSSSSSSSSESESEPACKRLKGYRNFLRDENHEIPRTTQWRWNHGPASISYDAEDVSEEMTCVTLPNYTIENNQRESCSCGLSCAVPRSGSNVSSSCDAAELIDDAAGVGEVLSHVMQFTEGPANDGQNFAEVAFELENARPLDWDTDSDDAMSDVTTLDGSDNEENLEDAIGNQGNNEDLQEEENLEPEEIADNNEAVIDEPTLHTGTTLTLTQFQILFLTQIFRHKTSGQALEDYCRLLELLLPGKVPKSKYLFEKALPAFGGKSKCNIFCAECVAFIGCQGEIENAGNCQICGTEYNIKDSIKEGNFFLTISIEEQIRKTLETIDATTLLKKSDAEADVYSDILSGSKIQDMFKSGELTDDDLTLLWNFDGVPVFKSSNFSITPIQFTINELPYYMRKKNVLMYGLWFGKTKPKASTFLKPLIDEATQLAEDGMKWHGLDSEREHQSRVYFLAASCDSVARPIIQNTVQFNGAYGCDWCFHEGERVERGNGYARCYPLRQHGQEARTAEIQEDLGIQAEEQGETVQGVKGVTVLSLLPGFDIVEGFVVDYMHCVLLGVTRQFTTLWFDSQYHEEPWYIGTFSQNVTESLLAIKAPAELTRATRSLCVRKYWKASEWRSFLLFYSPVVLKGVLPNEFYNHWMLIVSCMHGLLKETVVENFLVTAEHVLRVFVILVKTLYGIQHVTFNVHQLTHIVDSVRRWGPLWATSAFPFEGNNQVLLGLFHGKTSAPQQIANKFNLKLGIKSAAPDILSAASVGVKQLYRRLSHTGRYLPVNERKVAGVYLYGKSVKKTMSVLSRAALERLLQQPIPAQKEFEHYSRFSNGRFLCHAFSYNRSKKRRNDMVLLVDGTLSLVKELVLYSPCHCEFGACGCEPEPFVIVQKLKVKDTAFFTSHRYHVNYDEHLEVQDTVEFLAARIDSLDQKCVAIKKQRKLFAVPIPNRYETD